MDQFIMKDVASKKNVCSICRGFSHKSRTNVRNHIESKHYPGLYQYPCETCSTVVYTKRALEVHRSAYHAK